MVISKIYMQETMQVVYISRSRSRMQAHVESDCSCILLLLPKTISSPLSCE